jgi:hypothetical protein
MDPVQAWTLMGFVTLMSTALLLLELGMRRVRAPRTRQLRDRSLRRDH